MVWFYSFYLFCFVFGKALFFDGVLRYPILFVLFSIKRCFVMRTNFFIYIFYVQSSIGTQGEVG